MEEGEAQSSERNFYPRPPCGGRLAVHSGNLASFTFLSTPSVRRATKVGLTTKKYTANFYPRPPCGGRPFNSSTLARQYSISIHALRAEGDAIMCRMIVPRKKFLSTPSVRRATPGRRSARLFTAYFYPRPPCGGRLLPVPRPPIMKTFLSTPSVRRATLISHITARKQSYFYPRPPCGGRRIGVMYLKVSKNFSPPPRGGVHPAFVRFASQSAQISIHALRAEGDPGCE